MKKDSYPEPGTEAFTQLGPEAKCLARTVHNITPIKDNDKTSRTQETTLDNYTEQEGR